MSVARLAQEPHAAKRSRSVETVSSSDNDGEVVVMAPQGVAAAVSPGLSRFGIVALPTELCACPLGRHHLKPRRV
jgi:hypothetical protein